MSARDWPACATYPGLDCVCRGGLQANKATCTRKRTGDLTPTVAAPDPTAGEREHPALRNAGPWEHLDGTPCPYYVASRPRPDADNYWWCTEHQQHVRVVNGDIRNRDALISYLEVRLSRAEDALKDAAEEIAAAIESHAGQPARNSHHCEYLAGVYAAARIAREQAR